MASTVPGFHRFFMVPSRVTHSGPCTLGAPTAHHLTRGTPGLWEKSLRRRYMTSIVAAAVKKEPPLLRATTRTLGPLGPPGPWVSPAPQPVATTGSFVNHRPVSGALLLLPVLLRLSLLRVHRLGGLCGSTESVDSAGAHRCHALEHSRDVHSRPKHSMHPGIKPSLTLPLGHAPRRERTPAPARRARPPAPLGEASGNRPPAACARAPSSRTSRTRFSGVRPTRT